jgi:two-component system nitrogen regulation sensor histidine kinase NtrY
MKLSDLLRYRKDPRFIVALPLAIAAATTIIYYLMQRAKELSPEALTSRLVLFVLWNINLLLILGILFVLLRAVVKLVLERARGILGSRFRSKLVATYLATALVPIVVLFLFATDLLRVSIDRWFNTPVARLLENSSRIAETAEDRAAEQARGAAREIAAELEKPGVDLDRVLRHVGGFHTVDLVGAYRHGSLVRLIANPRTPINELREPPPKYFEEVMRRGELRKIDVGPGGKWIRHAIRVGPPKEGQVAMAGVFIPIAISRMIDENLIAYQDFRQLDTQKETLKASQTSLFLTVTLAMLFGTLWTAIYTSRRITEPVQALAEGTRTLAEGNYAHRIDLEATDEFGLLIGSFNTMAAELETQKNALTASNTEMQRINERLDTDRAYLSTVLENVSSGIIAFSDSLEVLSINRAAMRILQLGEVPLRSRIDQIVGDDLQPLRAYIGELGEREPRPRELTLTRGGEIRYVEVSAARLETGAETRGWVLAIEDSTQLVQAQKIAAWSEAARRIAHEIKNPLTPIQLSAERIAKKFRNEDPDFPHAVEEGCKTIVEEVAHLKTMVDEFSRFARMPAVHLRQSSVAEVLQQVARLYADVKPRVSVVVDAPSELHAVIDPEQIRRALINLLDNALEATSEGEIVLAARRRGRALCLSVTDPGRGIPDADKEKLFLPHFSTKKRGTGLGLAIVHRIVHDHEGTITVHDNPAGGTRFEIEIPA